MAKVIFRQKAINDLTEIWEYTLKNWSEKQADFYYRTIKTACDFIGENRNIGRNYSEINNRLFGFKTGKHIVFYQIISEDEIEVIRILHEKMDLRNRISE